MNDAYIGAALRTPVGKHGGSLASMRADDLAAVPIKAVVERSGLDGADWVVEGRRAGLYHAVIRWEPKPGPFRDACEELIKASGVSFPAEIR